METSLLKVKRAIGRWRRVKSRKPKQRWGLDFLSEYSERIDRKPQVIFDVGGHLGETALAYSDFFPRARVYTFEPTLENLKAMENVLSGKPEVIRVQSAVGNTTGKVRFRFNPEHPSMSRISEGDKDGYDVRITTLDDFVEREDIARVSLLKIDTEGHELNVLAGARRILKHALVDVLILEVGFAPRDPVLIYFPKIFQILSEFGYQVFGFYEQYENVLQPGPHLHRSDVAFISPNLVSEGPPADAGGISWRNVIPDTA